MLGEVLLETAAFVGEGEDSLVSGEDFAPVGVLGVLEGATGHLEADVLALVELELASVALKPQTQDFQLLL